VASIPARWRSCPAERPNAPDGFAAYRNVLQPPAMEVDRRQYHDRVQLVIQPALTAAPRAFRPASCAAAPTPHRPAIRAVAEQSGLHRGEQRTLARHTQHLHRATAAQLEIQGRVHQNLWLGCGGGLRHQRLAEPLQRGAVASDAGSSHPVRSVPGLPPPHASEELELVGVSFNSPRFLSNEWRPSSRHV
jgi:hypothetical protein